MEPLLNSFNRTSNTTDDFNDNDVDDPTQDDSILSFKIQKIPYVVSIDIIVGLGIIGNVFTIILMTSKSLRNHSYAVYLLVLAVSDSFVLSMIATEDNLDHIFGLLHTMMTSHIFVCKCWTFVQEWAVTLSPWVLTSMTVDRYIVVVFPLHKTRFCIRKYSLIVCLVLGLIGATLSAPTLYYSEIINFEDGGIYCDFPENQAFMDYSYAKQVLIDAVLPTTITIILNIHTVIVLRRASKSALQRTKSSRSLNDSNVLKISISLVLVSFLSAVALVPFSIVSLVEYIIGLTEGPDTLLNLLGELWMLFNVVRLLNYGMNFYVLISFSAHYRRVLRQRICCYTCCRLSLRGKHLNTRQRLYTSTASEITATSELEHTSTDLHGHPLTDLQDISPVDAQDIHPDVQPKE